MPDAATPEALGIDAINRILMGDGTSPAEPEQAGKLYREAINAGNGAAAVRLAVLAALGVGQPRDFLKAFDLLAEGAELGDRSAQKQLAVLADRAELTTGKRGPAHWRKLRGEIDLAELLQPPSLKQVFPAPNVAVMEGFATKAMCKWIIGRGQGNLKPSMTADLETGKYRPDPTRSALSLAFTLYRTDLVFVVLQERLKRLTNLPLHNHEPPNLLSYEPGQEYKAHYDFVPLGVPALDAEMQVLGQRVATCLTYLNNDYEGGETLFGRLDWKFRGKTGDAMLFWNVTSDGQPDKLTLHAGLPVVRGRKYLLSQWLRTRVQPLFPIREG